MRISAHQIPADGREILLNMDEKWAREGVAAGTSGQVLSLEGRLFLQAYDAQIRVQGEVHAKVQCACDRCAEDVEWEVDEGMDLSYLPEGTRDDGSRALASDELDIGFYPDEGLHLGEVLQEFFALEVPARLTCDAASVRPISGEPCSPDSSAEEPQRPVDPRFAALAGLKLDEG